MQVHRYFLAVPFVLLLAITLIGGQLNSVDARGKVIDDSTGQPVAGVSITYGQNRGAVSARYGIFRTVASTGGSTAPFS